MEKIKYNGQYAEIVTTPQVFEKPKEMLAWNGNLPTRRMIVAILPNGTAIDTDKNWLRQCAFIPEKPAPRRATTRELSKWLAQGNGEVMDINGVVDTVWVYPHIWSKESVRDCVKVRKWDDTEWHEPNVEYMGLEE